MVQIFEFKYSYKQIFENKAFIFRISNSRSGPFLFSLTPRSRVGLKPHRRSAPVPADKAARTLYPAGHRGLTPAAHTNVALRALPLRGSERIGDSVPSLPLRSRLGCHDTPFGLLSVAIGTAVPTLAFANNRVLRSFSSPCPPCLRGEAAFNSSASCRS